MRKKGLRKYIDINLISDSFLRNFMEVANIWNSDVVDQNRYIQSFELGSYRCEEIFFVAVDEIGNDMFDLNIMLLITLTQNS